MVFQNYSLFPHMTVVRNVAFPLEVRGVPKKEAISKAHTALELVELSARAGFYPRQLFGGQQQRVALARASVFEPALLLMDEPLGALDKRLRESMQIEIKRISRELGATVVFVTHDQEEAPSSTWAPHTATTSLPTQGSTCRAAFLASMSTARSALGIGSMSPGSLSTSLWFRPSRTT